MIRLELTRAGRSGPRAEGGGDQLLASTDAEAGRGAMEEYAHRARRDAHLVGYELVRMAQTGPAHRLLLAWRQGRRRGHAGIVPPRQDVASAQTIELVDERPARRAPSVTRAATRPFQARTASSGAFARSRPRARSSAATAWCSTARADAASAEASRMCPEGWKRASTLDAARSRRRRRSPAAMWA